MKQLILIFSLMVITPVVFSQVEESVPTESRKDKENIPPGQRIVFEADIGLNFGSITYIKLAPVAGYRITDRWTAGLGPIYIYQRYKEFDIEYSIYGGKTFASFTFYKGSQRENRFGIGDLLLHTENEVINVEHYKNRNRIWIDNLLLGVGMFQPLGGRLGVSIYVLWDVTQNFYSPYYRSNPVFKFGFNF